MQLSEGGVTGRILNFPCTCYLSYTETSWSRKCVVEKVIHLMAARKQIEREKRSREPGIKYVLQRYVP